jgi:hypothetical protein
VLTRMFEGLEDRLVAFLFWSAVFVPLLLGAATVAHRYDVVDVDMLAGTNAPEDGDGEWSSIGTSLASWTPKKPQPPTPNPEEGVKPGGDGQSGTDAVEGGEPTSASAPSASGSAPKRGEGAAAGSDPGSGKGSGDGAGATTRARPTSAGGGVAGKPKECLPPDPRISKKSETDYDVDREIVDYYARHLKEFDDLARTLAYTDEDGNPNGFRITGMRCGNPLMQAGIKNGDVVTAVNGKRVNTTLQAASTYLKLRNEDHLRLEVTRRGAPVFLEYDVNE